MPDNVSISINGQSRVPPGFRFHPTEEELLQYYLKRKARSETIDLNVIVEIDLNKLEPWDIKEKCQIGGSALQSDWYFFSHKDKKYPTGTRTNRATIAGFWKATGRDKIIYGCAAGARIGMRKTLVFYTGRAPLGLKSDWIMHEYRLGDDDDSPNEEGWVICKIFRKKQHKNKSKDRLSPVDCSIENKNPDEQTLGSYSNQNSVPDIDGTLEVPAIDGTLEQIFQQHIRPTQSATVAGKEDENSHVPNNDLTAGNTVFRHDSILSNWQYTTRYDNSSLHSLCMGNNPNPNLQMNSQLGIYPDDDSVYQDMNGFSGGYHKQNLNCTSDVVGGGISNWTTMDHVLMISASQHQLQEAEKFDAGLLGPCASAAIPNYHDQNNGHLQLPATAALPSTSPMSHLYCMQPTAHDYISYYGWIDPLSTLF